MSKREVNHYNYTLSNRPFIGTTTTKHELAFIMCNLANIQRGDLVYDPFMGTGSLLISASVHGGICYGSDISYNSMFPIHSKHGGKNIFTNFDHYQLERPEVFLSDFSKQKIKNGIFNAIICDPPFGIREHYKLYSGIRSIKATKTKYTMDNLYHDLLQKSADLLKDQGNLVFLLHTDESIMHDINAFNIQEIINDISTYSQLRFVSISENKLTKTGKNKM